MTTPNLDSLTRVLSTYPGRDKALRSLCFLLQLHAQGSDQKSEILALAKQLSSARLIMRQLNHPSMMKACKQVMAGWAANPKEKVEFGCGAAVTGIYSVYGVVELVAWLSDAKLLAFDSARLWRWCLYLWISALIAGIIRQVCIISRKTVDKAQEDIISLIGLSSDFMAAINSLPHKILWAGKLSARQSATFSLLASFIGFYKVF